MKDSSNKPVKKNLLYYICPIEGNQQWRSNVSSLVRYWKTFNHRKIVTIATGEGLFDPGLIEAEFPGDDIEFLHIENDPATGEAKPFLQMLQMVQSTDPDEMSFYAHAKGVSPRHQEDVFQGIKTWRELSYLFCLDDEKKIEQVLDQFACCGCFKKQHPQGSNVPGTWHFSGTFFWFKHRQLFSQPGWNGYVGDSRCAVEGYLGTLFDTKQAKSLFAEVPNGGVLRRYKRSDWSALLRNCRKQQEMDPAQVLLAERIIHQSSTKEEVINQCLGRVQGSHYLEIGVQRGLSLRKVKAARKWGVDPDIALARNPLINASLDLAMKCRGTRLFRMTSDAFFETECRDLEGTRFDVALVDGLHTYQQSLNDVLNCLNHLSDDGIIVVDDCNPRNRDWATPANSIEEAAKQLPPDWNRKWSGDVWKAIVHLRATRNDLVIWVLDAQCGIGLIKRGKPGGMPDISVEQIHALTYADLEQSRTKLLNLQPADRLADFLG